MIEQYARHNGHADLLRNASTGRPATKRVTGGELQAGVALLSDHVARFNAGVRSGDFGPMVDGFTDDAELVFEGIPVGPFRGRAAIAAAYRNQPPDDEIELLDVDQDSEGQVVASYAWSERPGVRAGALVLLPEEGRIARLVIHYGDDGRPATEDPPS